jgi:hypothetical protein
MTSHRDTLLEVKEALEAAPVYVTKDGTWLNLRPDANKSKGGAMFKVGEPECEALKSFELKRLSALSKVNALLEAPPADRVERVATYVFKKHGQLLTDLFQEVPSDFIADDRAVKPPLRGWTRRS